MLRIDRWIIVEKLFNYFLKFWEILVSLLVKIFKTDFQICSLESANRLLSSRWEIGHLSFSNIVQFIVVTVVNFLNWTFVHCSIFWNNRFSNSYIRNGHWTIAYKLGILQFRKLTYSLMWRLFSVEIEWFEIYYVFFTLVIIECRIFLFHYLVYW